MVDKSRVVIGALSRCQLLRVETILKSQPDMEIVGPVGDAVELLIAVRETDADAVILPLDKGGEEPGLCSHLLAEFPGLMVLAISASGQHIFLFDQAISRTELVDDGKAMVNMIRLAKAGE
jgi:hypothetical protein